MNLIIPQRHLVKTKGLLWEISLWQKYSDADDEDRLFFFLVPVYFRLGGYLSSPIGQLY